MQIIYLRTPPYIRAPPYTEKRPLHHIPACAAGCTLLDVSVNNMVNKCAGGSTSSSTGAPPAGGTCACRRVTSARIRAARCGVPPRVARLLTRSASAKAHPGTCVWGGTGAWAWGNRSMGVGSRSVYGWKEKKTPDNASAQDGLCMGMGRAIQFHQDIDTITSTHHMELHTAPPKTPQKPTTHLGEQGYGMPKHLLCMHLCCCFLPLFLRLPPRCGGHHRSRHGRSHLRICSRTRVLCWCCGQRRRALLQGLLQGGIDGGAVWSRCGTFWSIVCGWVGDEPLHCQLHMIAHLGVLGGGMWGVRGVHEYCIGKKKRKRER